MRETNLELDIRVLVPFNMRVVLGSDIVILGLQLIVSPLQILQVHVSGVLRCIHKVVAFSIEVGYRSKARLTTLLAAAGVFLSLAFSSLS